MKKLGKNSIVAFVALIVVFVLFGLLRQGSLNQSFIQFSWSYDGDVGDTHCSGLRILGRVIWEYSCRFFPI